MGIYDNEREQLQSQVDKLEMLLVKADKELDDEQCQNDTFRDEVVELDGLREERDMLAEENKNMAKHLLANGCSPDEVDNICKGFDDWEDVDPNEPTPSQMNEELRSGGW
jgi:hypothetical protein